MAALAAAMEISPPHDHVNERSPRQPTAVDVARIAALFVNGGKGVAESAALALELLEASRWALQYAPASGKAPDYTLGVRLWEKYKAHHEEIRRYMSRVPRPEWKPNDSGAFEPMPFDEAMALFFPRVKVTDRMPRFRVWLMVSRQWSLIRAGEEIGRLRQSGIAKEDFDVYAMLLPMWWDARVKQKRAEAAKGKERQRRGRKVERIEEAQYKPSGLFGAEQ
jgi:hypothetical protein